MEILQNGLNNTRIPIGISTLGTPIFDNVVFPEGQYVDNEGNIIAFEKVRFDSAQLVVSQTKEIIKSQISGKVGTIKEYVTTGDYAITLTAVIAPTAFGLIDADVMLSKFAKLNKVPEAVEIRCKHLQNNYDINKVVIESVNIEVYKSDSYTVTAEMISDFEINLDL